MTLAELIGPNIEFNKFLLKSARIKNYHIPFISHSNLLLYGIENLKSKQMTIYDVGLGYYSGKGKEIKNLKFSVFYLDDITNEQIKRLIELRMDNRVKDLETLKIELL